MKHYLVISFCLLATQSGLSSRGDLKVTHRAIELFVANGLEECRDSSGLINQVCPELTFQILLDQRIIPNMEFLLLGFYIVPNDCFSPFPNIDKVLQLNEASADDQKEIRFFSELVVGLGTTCEGFPARKIEVIGGNGMLPENFENYRQLNGKKTLIRYTRKLVGTDCNKRNPNEIKECKWAIQDLKIDKDQ